MDAEILEAFAECDEIKGTLAVVGLRIEGANTKHAVMRGELAVEIQQIEELDAQKVEMRGTLAPLDRQAEGAEAELVAIKVTLALRTQQLAASTAEQTDARAELALRSQQLVASNIELERFAYITAHDLQEPVRTVVAFSQLLQRHLGDALDAESRDYLGFIITGAHRMGDQVRALMSYLLMTGDHTATVAVGLDEVVREARENLSNLIDERGVHFEIGPLPTVAGNRVLLTEVFQNLFTNAIKFTPADSSPRINISARHVGDLWRLAVSDKGIGIAPEYHKRIFNIFECLNPGSANSGTGIGLAVCKGIIERLGGGIWVESEEGLGATFVFTLPDNPTGV